MKSEALNESHFTDGGDGSRRVGCWRVTASCASGKADGLELAISDLRAQIAALDGQVKAAMQFQENEKKVREQREKAESEDRSRRESLAASLREFIEAGTDIEREMFQKREEARLKHQNWVTGTSKDLHQLVGLADCAQEFDNPDFTSASILFGLPKDMDARVLDVRARVRGLRRCLERLRL